MPATDSDFVVNMDCGCKVTYFAASDLRSSRMDVCNTHNRKDGRQARDRIKKIADRTKMHKFGFIPVLPWSWK